MYKLYYFIIQEFVSEPVYNLLGEESLLLIDDEILITADQLREYFDATMYINDYIFGGKFHERGFRLRHSLIGAKNSQHKLGKAIDFTVEGLKPATVQAEIIQNQRLFPFIRRMEKDTPRHTHIDTKTTRHNGLYVFKP